MKDIAKTKKLIKLSFITHDQKSNKDGFIECLIQDNRAMIKFDNNQTTDFVFENLIKNKKKAIKTRGFIIQFFQGMKKEDIKELLVQDIRNGVETGEKVSKRKISIVDYKEELI